MARIHFAFLLGTIGLAGRLAAQQPTVDLSAYRPESGITVGLEADQLRISWPSEHRTGRLDLGLRPGQPLIRTMGFAAKTGELEHALIKNADPVTFLLVG